MELFMILTHINYLDVFVKFNITKVNFVINNKITIYFDKQA